MNQRRCLALILAAGEGTRMKSNTPKVLHHVAGRSMLGHVIATAQHAGADTIAVVVGPDHSDVETEAHAHSGNITVFRQMERLGTAHAVLSARQALQDNYDDVIVLFGDTPLVQPETLKPLREALAKGAAVAVLGFEANDPTGYGRLLLRGSELVAIREQKDATEEERAVTFCNGGIMAFSGKHALELLDGIDCNNAAKEYYLTDIVKMARSKGLQAVATFAPEAELQGVNSRAQLATVEAEMQQQLRLNAMQNGVTLHDPASVYFAFDTEIGRDVIVEPHVVFGTGVRVGEGSVIHAFSHLQGCEVGAGVTIGPFARLRPGSKLDNGVKIGNFVELKNTHLAAGAKVNHLSYIGDAEVGASANIGAGTITCNYDGTRKYKTVIGAGAFVGSNSALVAPVTIGKGAFVGAGSTITEDVPEDCLGIARGIQINKPGWKSAKK